MTEDMLVKIDLDGNVLLGGAGGRHVSSAASSGGDASVNSDPVAGSNASAYRIAAAGGTVAASNSDGKPSSEIKMHLAVYRRSPGLKAVCHAHPPVSAAFAAAGVALDMPFLQEAVMLLGIIPVAEYAPPGSGELADGAASFCLDYHGALLEHHGAVTWGESIMQALYRMESVEYTATVAMYSKMLGFSHTLDSDRVDELTAMRAKWGITIPGGKWRIEN